MQSDSDIIYYRHQLVQQMVNTGLNAAEIIEEVDRLVRYIVAGRQTDNALDQNTYAPTEA